MTTQVSQRDRGRFKNAIGPAAADRRKAYLTAMRRALERTPWREMRVIELSKDIGCSPATFYWYFATLEEAFDALFEQLLADGETPVPMHVLLIHELLDFERTSMGGRPE